MARVARVREVCDFCCSYMFVVKHYFHWARPRFDLRAGGGGGGGGGKNSFINCALNSSTVGEGGGFTIHRSPLPKSVHK